MKCKHCDVPIKKSDQLCSSCGYPVDDTEIIERKKDSVKAILFLTMVFILLTMVIYDIHQDPDGSLTHQLPLQLSVEDSKDLIIGNWMSEDERSIIEYATFDSDNFEFKYADKNRNMSGAYSVEDSNTVILFIKNMNGISTPENLDMNHKFYFDNDDTLIIIFNGFSNTFKRQV